MITDPKYIKFYKSLYSEELLKKAMKIKLLAFDVDGVLTDGGLYVDQNGNENKRFYAQDGHGIKILQTLGIKTMIISGRKTDCVNVRGAELGIDYIVQGSRDKLKSFHDQNTSTSLDEVCFVGDDTVDIELLQNVGMSIIVPNSNPILKEQEFDWITNRSGGNGAIRDVCDLIYFSKTLNEKT
tara:strand:+ start:2056 stop:2604 length:549 start_codon:yes stop_codon:yes gene_type:complete